MRNNGNWFKIRRDILDNPLMQKPIYLAVWIYILANVAYENTDVLFDGNRITLKPGQGFFSLSEIAQRWGVSQSGINKVLKRFEMEKQIEQQTTYHGRLITAVNWDKYQKTEKQTEKQSASKVQAKCKQSKNLPIKAKNLRNKEAAYAAKEEKSVPECTTNFPLIDYYEQKIHPLTQKFEAEVVKSLTEEFSAKDFMAAVDKAAANSNRLVSAYKYIETILRTGGVKGPPESGKKPNDPEAGAEEARQIIESGELDAILK